jgi:hypothetical protein
MNKQIDYDYMIAKKDFDESKLNLSSKKQTGAVKQSDNFSKKIESKK